MTKCKFIKKWNQLETHITNPLIRRKVDYLCVLIGERLNMKALEVYRGIFSGGSYSVSISGNYLNSKDQQNKQRLIALELFYNMCITEKLYKEF